MKKQFEITDINMDIFNQKRGNVISYLNIFDRKNTFKQISESYSGENRYPEIYIDIINNEEFINSFQYLGKDIFAQHQKNLEYVIKTFYPGTKLRHYKNVSTGKLNSFYFRRFLTFIDFLNKDESWKNFFREFHPSIYRAYTESINYYDKLIANGSKTDSNDNTFEMSIKKDKNGSLSFSLPTYLEYIASDTKKIDSMYHDINYLINFSYYVNLLGDVYMKCYDIIFEKRNEEIVKNEENLAINNPILLNKLNQRIVSLDDLTPTNDFEEKLKEISSKLNISEIIIPFSRKIPIVKDGENPISLGVVIPKISNEQKASSYKLVPPLPLSYTSENYNAVGIYNVIGFDNDVDEDDIACHLVEGDSLASLDEKLFLETLLEFEYFEELTDIIQNTLLLINEISNESSVVINSVPTYDENGVPNGIMEQRESPSNSFENIVYALNSLILDFDINSLKKQDINILSSLYSYKDTEIQTLLDVLNKPKVTEPVEPMTFLAEEGPLQNGNIPDESNTSPLGFINDAIIVEDEYSFIHDTVDAKLKITKISTGEVVLDFNAPLDSNPAVLSTQIKMFIDSSDTINIPKNKTYTINRRNSNNELNAINTITF